IDASMVDNETGWVSTHAARKALREICETLGSVDTLRRRGEWVTNAEALGAHVRMLRTAEQPVDAYQYLADNVREVTRVGSWDFELAGAHAPKKAPSPVDADESDAERRDAARKLPKDKASIRAVRLVYR